MYLSICIGTVVNGIRYSPISIGPFPGHLARPLSIVFLRSQPSSHSRLYGLSLKSCDPSITTVNIFVSFLSVALACPRSGLDGACLESTSPKLYLDPVYYSRRPFDPLIEEILADLFPDA